MGRGRRAPLAVLVTLLCACQGEADARARAEAGSMVQAVRALRDADNDAKAPRLAALRSMPCSAPDVCELKNECVAAYELYLAGLDAVRAVKKSLDSDAGADEAKKAGELLESAQKDVEGGRKKAERCTLLEGRVVDQRKLR